MNDHAPILAPCGLCGWQAVVSGTVQGAAVCYDCAKDYGKGNMKAIAQRRKSHDAAKDQRRRDDDAQDRTP